MKMLTFQLAGRDVESQVLKRGSPGCSEEFLSREDFRRLRS